MKITAERLEYLRNFRDELAKQQSEADVNISLLAVLDAVFVWVDCDKDARDMTLLALQRMLEGARGMAHSGFNPVRAPLAVNALSSAIALLEIV